MYIVINVDCKPCKTILSVSAAYLTPIGLGKISGYIVYAFYKERGDGGYRFDIQRFVERESLAII